MLPRFELKWYIVKQKFPILYVTIYSKRSTFQNVKVQVKNVPEIWSQAFCFEKYFFLLEHFYIRVSTRSFKSIVFSIFYFFLDVWQGW